MPGAADCLSACRTLSDDFAGRADDDLWRLGAVAFAEAGGGLTAIRKAPRPGYEFGGLWALPGGMVRPENGEHAARAAERSLTDRVLSESGLQIQGLQIAGEWGPVVSRYTVRGRLCFTLIVSYAAQTEDTHIPPTDDRTVTQVSAFAAASLPLGDFAPANRLLIAHRIWPSLTHDQQSHVRVAVQAALDDCSIWAAAARITPPAAPWDSPEIIRRWTDGWPA